MTKLNAITLPNGATLRNPLMMAPMTTQLSFYNGQVTKDEIEYYANRAKDVGAVIVGAANVQAVGKGWHGELGIYDDSFLPGLSQLAKEIKARGAKAIIQIFHAGRMTNRDILSGEQPVSASAVPALRPNAETPRELSQEEIIQLIEDFKLATRRAIQAGFDGVEIHGANTYIIQQFFSPHSNRRTDEWGGTQEKRFKFINDLVDGILQTVADFSNQEFIVGYRFSPEEFEDPGLRMDDCFYLLEHLSQKKLDYLHLSTNDYNRISQEEAYANKSILNYVSKHLNKKVPLVGVGGVETIEHVEDILQHAQLVAVGRSLIHDPDWAGKILRGNSTTRLKELGFDLEQYYKYGLWQFVQSFRLDK
ncbi:NADH-dependent flavin oxidoreductase [Streptococcus merionis]|uniref:NADH:flavin oxidoreductase/NADH oxidase family protein n=1 Tax=Streptococcus merionis TaxID=400065 RepID=A0A239SNW9_9STRE|nr:NADH-dependent flavin oxidoreductase [Streptococcus merionis]SNU87090.1 NADH:flavin oxidoreductase/NADH oxidase family protein [Streptococcus merionis]